MSSSLCRVALETVTPPTSTGSSIAHGFSAPVRPTRSFVQGAEPGLLLERIDLDHDSVDLVVELRAAHLPLPASLHHVLDRLEPLRIRIGAKTVLAQPLERLPVRGRCETVAAADAVNPDGKRSCGGDRGVLLAKRPGGRIAGIRRRRFALRRQPLVELTEAGERYVHLASDLENRWRIVADIAHLQGNRTNRAKVRGHLFALV